MAAETHNHSVGPRALLVLRVLFTLALAASIAFIFLHSSEIGNLSGLRSQTVTAWLNGVMARLGTGIQFSEAEVRKLAHFAEFALLGFWLMLTLRVYTRHILAFVSWPLLGGLCIAVADEFLQYFVPGRSSSVVDVLIDFAGVVVGLCVALFFQLLVGAIIRSIKDRQAGA